MSQSIEEQLMPLDIEYYSGTFCWWDADDDMHEHKVVWAKGKTAKDDPEDWYLIEVDDKEEHECDSEVWHQCEEGFAKTALTLCMEI